jgi:glutathione S-transferase
MMIKVWGRATSLNVQIVMWALAELDLACERIDVGGAFGGLDTPEFLSMNPNGRIPVIEDKGAVLWESAAIVRYLGAEYGSESFWPADHLSRARLDQWAEWAKSSFGPELLNGIFVPLVPTPPDKRDLDAVAASAGRLQRLAGIIDVRIGNGPYLGGEEPCFADIIVGAYLYRYFTLDFPRAETPNLEAWYRRLAARPAYARHVMVSYEALKAR